MSNPLFSVNELVKHFPVKGGLLLRTTGYIKAVDGVSFDINSNETFGIVGESGCGKTTLARSVLRLIEPSGGDVFFKGENVIDLKGNELKGFRREAQIVFQNPFSALHPRKMIKDIVGEPLRINSNLGEEEIIDKVIESLLDVGLTEEHIYRYPHEFSGGQRQRVVIARSLIMRPKLVVLDEPTASLDVSVQAKILNLLKRLQKEYNLTYLLISHNFSIIDYLCDRIGVMYLGKLIEVSSKGQLFDNPQHPYTQALISAIPLPDAKRKSEPIILRGEVPSPLNPPSGCRFHTRCQYTKESCSVEEPQLVDIGDGRLVACHRQSR
jgi:oligopeptide/dipeptide ABC transporter ATP-binding protein